MRAPACAQEASASGPPSQQVSHPLPPRYGAQFLLACEADSRGRTGFEDKEYPQADFLRDALVAANSVNIAELLKDLAPSEEKGPEKIKAAIAQARTEAIAKAIGKAA